MRNAFDRGIKNCTMTSDDIQKELATYCALEVTKVIIEELGDRQFSVLIDESGDIFSKEQMTVMLRLIVVFFNFQFLLPIILYAPSTC